MNEKFEASHHAIHPGFNLDNVLSIHLILMPVVPVARSLEFCTHPPTIVIDRLFFDTGDVPEIEVAEIFFETMVAGKPWTNFNNLRIVSIRKEVYKRRT